MLCSVPSVVIHVTGWFTLTVTSWGWKAKPTVLMVAPEPDADDCPAAVVVVVASPDDSLSLLQAAKPSAATMTHAANRAGVIQSLLVCTAAILGGASLRAAIGGAPPRPGGMGRGARPTRPTREPEPRRRSSP